MNAVILFSLSQPNMVVKAIIPAILSNLIIGFLLSRWISYEYAVIGLFIGTILLAILSTRSLIKVFKNLDYYLYAAS
jgi:predicted benzoate:H+ symporter BenE